jgi:threonine/homoserine/homoserine lactone efflux protein
MGLAGFLLPVGGRGGQSGATGMDTDFFVRGLVIGFSIAAPVGPIGLLCIRRTLADGRLVGLVAGLGAATADAIYGLVAGFGLTAVSGFLIGQGFWLRLIGGAFLCWLGARIFLSEPATRAASVGGRGLAGAYASTLALTLTNPTTILSFVAIFAGLGVASVGDYASATVLVVGVFVGSALWWLLLSGGVSLLRGAVTPARLRWVNRLAGAIIAILGLLSIGSLIWGG